MVVGIIYLQNTKQKYDIEHSDEIEEMSESQALKYIGKTVRTKVYAEDIKAGWRKYMEALAAEGWELYAWNAVIKGDVVRYAFGAYDMANPRHQFGYDIKEVITKIAANHHSLL